MTRITTPFTRESTAAEVLAGVDLTGNSGIFVARLELADRASVRAFADGWDGPLHILVNNAGVMAEPLNRNDAWSAYGQSKTANALFAVEATKRWAPDGITANALMPGGIRTALQRHLSPEDDPELQAILDNYRWKTPEQGAATSALLAGSPLLEGIGGRYFEDCNEATGDVVPGESGVAPHALDPEAATRLWDLSIQHLQS